MSSNLQNAPLKLCWWNGKNFGDALSPLVVSYASGRAVEACDRSESELFAVGSIMIRAQRGFSSEQAHRPAIWGTGMMGPHRANFVSNVDFFAVRGPATAALLDIPIRVFGDPGLLLADLATTEVKRGQEIGIVPHHGDFKHRSCRAKIAELKKQPGIRIIDTRTHNALAVADEIRSCRHVFSSSLHGLIVADAHGVPSTWVAGRSIHKNASFKFLDYFLSVGRPWKNPIDYDEILLAETQVRNVDTLTYAEGIVECKAALLDAFPKHLRAQQPTAT